MKLYMKQKVFSWRDKFTIKDRFEQDKYFVEGELISIGKQLHILDANHNEVAFVKEKVLTLLPKFYVYVGGVQVAEIVKKLTFFKPKYLVNGLGWEVNGNFLAHDYKITQNGKPIVSIHKQWMAWGDTFELDVENEADEVTAVAVVLAIDAVMDAQMSSANMN